MIRQEFLKGAFGLCLLLGLSMGVAAWMGHFKGLPDVADFLPKEGTESVLIFKSKTALTHLQRWNPLALEPWVDALGQATVEGKTMIIVQINSSEQASAYLQSLRSEGEILTSKKATRSLWSAVTCYPASPNPCYTWLGDLLLLSDESTLINAQEVAAGLKPSLKENGQYQNLKSRVATWDNGFIYFDLQKILPHYAADFSIFEPFLELAPVFGASLRENQNDWSAESFLGFDKNLLSGTAYWHPTEKYQAKFLPWTSDAMTFEWGGQNLGAQVEQMLTVLSERTQQGKTLFSDELTVRLETLFGADFNFAQDLKPLLDGEQYFAFTPNEDFLWISSVDGDEEVQKTLALKDAFAQHFSAYKTIHTSSGETQLTSTELAQKTGQHGDYQYYQFLTDDQELATVLLTPNMVFVGGKAQTVFDAFDRSQGTLSPRSLDTVDSLLTGSNEFLSAHCLALPDGSILKTLLGDFNEIHLARKIFDDGSVARWSFSLTTP